MNIKQKTTNSPTNYPMAKEILQQANRIVVKVGSSLLVDEKTGLRKQWLDSLIDDIASLHKKNCEILIVSSGAIVLGKKILTLPNRPLRLDESQAAASVGQIELAHHFTKNLQRHNLIAAQILLTLNDTEGSASRRTYLNARDTISHLLKLKAVPVINENDTIATSEIRYGDNDRLAARVATMMAADLLILLSDIDGLYTKPPYENKNARLIDYVDKITPEIESMAGEKGSQLSRGGMKTKIQAAKITTSVGTNMIITSGKNLNPLQCLAKNCRCTLFVSREIKAARKKWIAGQLEINGKITIDDGAAKALLAGKSLLPAGVIKISGQFSRGDTVAILNKTGDIIARGLSGYDEEQAQKIIGKQSNDMVKLLGYEGRGVLIHRDNMVLENDNVKKL